MTTGAPPVGPAVNDRVRVAWDTTPGGQPVDLPTRVEDVREGLLVLAAPGFAGDLHVPEGDLEVTVSWATARGRCRQTFVLAVVVRALLPCWELRPTGEVLREQRRHFVRTPLSRRSWLTPAPSSPTPGGGAVDRPAAPVAVALLDLSEAGTRVRSSRQDWLRAGCRVVVGLDVDGDLLEQPAEVLRVEDVPDPAAGPSARPVEAVLVFLEPVVVADRVRRHVMKVQIENRRRGER